MSGARLQKKRGQIRKARVLYFSFPENLKLSLLPASESTPTSLNRCQKNLYQPCAISLETSKDPDQLAMHASLPLELWPPSSSRSSAKPCSARYPGIESSRRNLHASFVQDYKFSRRGSRWNEKLKKLWELDSEPRIQFTDISLLGIRSFPLI